MPFETESLIERARSLPADESSLNYAVRKYATDAEAQDAFERVKRSLRDAHEWNRTAGLSSYELFDPSGRQITSPVLIDGQFIKITLTGSGKADWVRVEGILDTRNELIITVKPTYDPTVTPRQTCDISHFFTAEARNNFCALHDGLSVAVYVIGLHEKLNSGHTSGMLETARNMAVANLGYYLGVQKAEWKKFCSSMLDGLGGESE